MADPTEPIVLLRRKADVETLRRLLRDGFHDMIKYVVDIERGIIAAGGELHADGEALLLEAGSEPTALWGANYYPGRGHERCIEFTALINIRPAQGNPGMEVSDGGLRERIRAVTLDLLGEGEPV